MMRSFVIFLALSAAGLIGTAFSVSAQTNVTSPKVQDGPTVFKRCAACHLATGAGVPGAYPPLKSNVVALATTAAGRRYLSLAIIRGVSGPIMIDGKTFRGTMPAQSGLNDAQVASVLNHVLKGSSAKAFVTKEVAGIRAGSASLNGAAVAKLRPDSQVK